MTPKFYKCKACESILILDAADCCGAELEELIPNTTDAAGEKGVKICRLVLADQAEAMELDRLELYEKMEIDLHVMYESATAGGKEGQRSMSGLTGGEGWKMKAYAENKTPDSYYALSAEAKRALTSIKNSEYPSIENIL